MATLNIQWPSATFPQSTKTLLANFFALVESKDPDSGEHIAHEIFTPDGVTKSGAMVYKGTKELIASRTTAWDYITSRAHHIIAVFDGDLANPGTDIMMCATLELGLKNGKEFTCEFGARAKIVGGREGEGSRLQSFETWTDSVPLRAALLG